jgi:hypothetical protein
VDMLGEIVKVRLNDLAGVYSRGYLAEIPE